MTLSFLGRASLPALQQILPSAPLPSFRIGAVGKCDNVLFFPEENPHVAAGHINWLSHGEEVASFQRELAGWLSEHGYKKERRAFSPHVTLAREPFSIEEWKKLPCNFPLILTGIHLYESVGNLTYQPLWSHPLLLPFEEFEHTADIAFLIRGESVREIHLHAQMALAFKFPPLLSFFAPESADTLDEIVMALNRLIARTDIEIGIPFKAVSFHGNLKTSSAQILEWEMIVDV